MKKYYTLEKNNNNWVIWVNKENFYKEHGNGGCDIIFSSKSKKECLDYCKANKMKLKRNI